MEEKRTDLVQKDAAPIKKHGSKERITLFDFKLKNRPKKAKNSIGAFLFETSKFLALSAAFAALFYLLSGGTVKRITEDASSTADTTATVEVGVQVPNTDETEIVFVPKNPINIIDESGVGVSQIDTDQYSLSTLMAASDGVKVIVIHSHTSEKVSKTQGVAALGELLSEKLNELGIKTYHCVERQDKNGVIGAYNNMISTLEGLLKTYPDTVCVIDIHDSDTDNDVTFSVGTSGVAGWQENFRLAAALSRAKTDGACPIIKLLPTALGQNSGTLSVHLGICGEEYEASAATAEIDAFANAFAALCKPEKN